MQSADTNKADRPESCFLASKILVLAALSSFSRGADMDTVAGLRS